MSGLGHSRPSQPCLPLDVRFDLKAIGQKETLSVKTFGHSPKPYPKAIIDPGFCAGA
jgi:hypothetical protein